MDDMPTMPGLDDAGAGATLAEVLGSLDPDGLAALVAEAGRARDAGELSDVGSNVEEAAPPPDAELSDPNNEVPPEEAAETPADEAAETPAEQAQEQEDGSELHDAKQYADMATQAAAEVSDLRAQVDTLMEGASEHEGAGLDTGPLEDALEVLQDAEEKAQAAQEAADEQGKAEEPDLSAAAAAAHDAQAAVEAARQAVADAKANLQEQVASLDDPDVAAMRTWAQQELV